MPINTYYRTEVRYIAMLVKDPLGLVLDRLKEGGVRVSGLSIWYLVAGAVNNGTRYSHAATLSTDHSISIAKKARRMCGVQCWCGVTFNTIAGRKIAL